MTALLTTGLCICSTAAATAQVDKPRTVSRTDRLPAPAKITATQIVPGGPIHVVWNAVDGAEKYSVTRSVPPNPAEPVTLPNPADTVYIERDPLPGSTYYYLVGAINEAGILGLRASAPPIRIPVRAPDAPGNFRVWQEGNQALLAWNTAPDAERYQLDRSTGATTAGDVWMRVNEPRCCQAVYPLREIPVGHHLRFRLRAVNRTGDISPPSISNEIVIAATESADTGTGTAPADTTAGQPTADTTTPGTANVRAAVVPAPVRLKVGSSLDVGKKSFFTSLNLRKVRWLSLDEARATVDARGKVSGRAVGHTYVVAIGLTPDGSVASVVQRVNVVKK
jgi:hypothetical protein